MPTLPPIDFSFTSKAGEDLAWRSTVSVTQSGVFHVTFPDVLMDVARTELSTFRKTPFDPLTIDQPRTQWQVQGPNLEECKAFLQQVAHAYLRTETTVDRLILYHIEPGVAYFRQEDGIIRPNAQGVSRDAYIAGRWGGSREQNSAGNHYALGFYAKVLDRVTERRGEHVAVRYVLPKLPEDSWGARLNSWTHLPVPTFHPYEMPWPHVPYTESAAEFFYQILLQLCTLADQLTDFLSDSTALTQALAGSSSLAPFAGLLALPERMPDHPTKA